MANVKSMVGMVVSTKMNKTVVVTVEKQKHHPLYHKTYRIMVKYKPINPGFWKLISSLDLLHDYSI